MTIYTLGTSRPDIDDSAYVAETATLIGRVTLGHQSSVWFQAVLRADNEPIVIAKASNVQDGAVLHCEPGFPLSVGEGVSVGHHAVLHGCSIGDGSLVGAQAVILHGARIGNSCLVAAGAVVAQGKTFPDHSLILGVPARAVRKVTPQERAHLTTTALEYVERAGVYRFLLQSVTRPGPGNAERPARRSDAV